MKIQKGLVVLVLLMFMIPFTVALNQPIVVRGTVVDIVTGEPVDKPKITFSIEDSEQNKEGKSKFNDPLGNWTKGGFDIWSTGSPGSEIVITAVDSKNQNCVGQSPENTVLPGGVGTGLIDGLRIEVCCEPNKPSDLNPAVLNILTDQKVDFEWKHGTRGNANYPDIWQIISVGGRNLDVPFPPLDSRTLISTASVDTKVGDSWEVTTCNGIKGGKFCCNNAGKSSLTENKPCPKPTNLVGKLVGVEGKETDVLTTWSSAVLDSEGHKCHDEWRAWSIDSGGSLEDYGWKSGTKNPANNAGEKAPAYSVTFWEVRSCDEHNRKEDSCSEWVHQVTPTCNSIKNICPALFNLEEEIKQKALKGLAEIDGAVETPLKKTPLKPITFSLWFLLVVLILIWYYARQVNNKPIN